jgi:heme oxygenase (biliverdin-producing, ferredoxin)
VRHVALASTPGLTRPLSLSVTQWTPTKAGYLRFLVESKAVYDAMESLMASGANPLFAGFVGTGLERGPGLAKDIAWFEAETGVTAEPASGAGAAYAAVLRQLAASDPPAFLCHWYNVYFAHSAGGRMIGTQVSKMLSLSRPLAFYEYEGEMSDHLAAVREKINDVAEKWSREEKDHCLAETAKSFELSGKLLRLIAE